MNLQQLIDDTNTTGDTISRTRAERRYYMALESPSITADQWDAIVWTAVAAIDPHGYLIERVAGIRYAGLLIAAAAYHGVDLDLDQNTYLRSDQGRQLAAAFRDGDEVGYQLAVGVACSVATSVSQTLSLLITHIR